MALNPTVALRRADQTIAIQQDVGEKVALLFKRIPHDLTSIIIQIKPCFLIDSRSDA